MRKLHHPRDHEIELANVLYALGDPVRLKIVQNLSLVSTQVTHTSSCKNICSRLTLSKSTLSHHFRILRESGVIWCEKEGTQYVNRLRVKELNALFPGLLKSILKSSSKI